MNATKPSTTKFLSSAISRKSVLLSWTGLFQARCTTLESTSSNSGRETAISLSWNRVNSVSLIGSLVVRWMALLSSPSPWTERPWRAHWSPPISSPEIASLPMTLFPSLTHTACRWISRLSSTFWKTATLIITIIAVCWTDMKKNQILMTTPNASTVPRNTILNSTVWDSIISQLEVNASWGIKIQVVYLFKENI